jgi:uncharacterized phage-associated protein
MYSKEHIEKIGNTIIFLTTRIPNLSKTRLLKLIYLLDEISIRQSGLPFLNLDYKVWKFGPVANDLFVELSDSPSMLKSYIDKKREGDQVYIIPKKGFDDDEFTQKEIELMNFVVERFGTLGRAELIDITHKKHSPWHNAAIKHAVLEDLESERISTTEFFVNMAELVEHDDRKKAIYLDYIENHGKV